MVTGTATTCTTGATVTAGNTCKITFTFKPGARGARTAQVIFTDDASGIAGSTQTLAGTSDPGHRLAALVPALFARYRFLAPWLRWSQHEAHLIPELGAFHARFREQHLQLIRDAIAPRGGGRAPAAAVGLVEVLTRYSSWEALTQDHGLSDDQAAAAVLGVLRPIITARREAPKDTRKHRATASQRGRAS